MLGPMHVYVALGGAPGTGKTTLTRTILQRLETLNHGPPSRHSLGVAHGLMYAEAGVFVFGHWRHGDVYAGTDRLSMSVQADALALVQYLHTQVWAGQHGGILAEGDRLYNGKMFASLAGMQPYISLRNVVLTAEPQVLQARYAQRGSSQKESFIKGRHTKIQNIGKVYGMEQLPTNTPAQAFAAQQRVWAALLPHLQPKNIS